MPIDFDPLFHTETMVRILREQGSTQLAMELAERILDTKPDHPEVRKLLEELKEEVRKNFERFKNSGRISENPEVAEAPRLRKTREERLTKLLHRIQSYRKTHEASPA